MKKIIILHIGISLLFLGCFEEEKKIVKKKIKKEPVEYMVKKVQKIMDKNTTLSTIIEEEGIVIDGSRDEDLLDAFGLAVSKVMEEEGVSVPDCTALAKTEFLSKEECDEISDKYFGFYDIYSEEGKISKVDDVFSTGIAGEDIEIREGEIEFFDSSGNPLLNNQVEFEEMVDENSDIDILKKLKAAIPKEKIEMLKKIEKKINFLKEIEDNNKKENITREASKTIKEDKDIEKSENITDFNHSDLDSNSDDRKSNMALYGNAKNALSNLISEHKRTELRMVREPNNQKLIDKYNQEEIDISLLEQKVDMYRSGIGS
ncbi:MAG TPA: hypothetical protein EYG73_00070 [Arcobacter sp.]|nr:hypothetical protein [Arcobacter sp.]